MQVNVVAAIDSGTTVVQFQLMSLAIGVTVDLRGDSIGESLATGVIYLTICASGLRATWP